MNNQNSHQGRRHVRRTSVDGFSAPKRPRVDSPSYTRRSNTILPGNESEYMIALGTSASRRHEQINPPSQTFWSKTHDARAKLTKKLLSIKMPKRTSQATKAAFVFAVVAISLVAVITTRNHNAAIASQDLQEILEDNGDTPSSKSPYGTENYAVAPDMPRQLIITKLGIDARVSRLSARQNSEPKSPQNINDVGWYENSAKPGESGASLLIGHVRGEEKQGAFYDLTRLVVGDTFQLRLGDGTIKEYYVVKLQAYPRNNVDFQELTQSALDGQPGMNLLTAVAAYESNSDVVQQLGVFAVEKSSFLED